MPDVDEYLKHVAIAVVAQRQPCSPYAVLDTLRRDCGVSHAAANTTMFALIRDGQLRRTFDGRLILAGVASRTPTGRIVMLVLFLVPIAVFIGWVFYNLVIGGIGP